MVIGADMVDVLVEDHRLIEGLLHEVASPGEEIADRESHRRLSVSIAELARHIVVEEEYLYPLVSEVLPDGKRLAAEGLSLSAQAERVMKRAENASAPEREPLVLDLVRLVGRHVRATEADLFPALRQACAPEQLDHLAGVVEMAKRTAPTHAHPGAPTGTPWSQIMSPGIGLVDKVRDALTGRPNRPEQL